MSDKQILEVMVKIGKLETLMDSLVSEIRRFRNEDKEKLQLQLLPLKDKLKEHDRRISRNMKLIWFIISSLLLSLLGFYINTSH